MRTLLRRRSPLRNDEIVLGENDIHLDFCLSLVRQQTSNGQHLYATAVHCHGKLGRAERQVA
ncbi:DUF2867 domain-containing protein [Burkholderia gladioli]|nr:DUF2867 domain-containing protein [Burkholderia gladioli]MDN7500218.1 DUF2867 domain-containing protein [Burkholderia gladioli]